MRFTVGRYNYRKFIFFSFIKRWQAFFTESWNGIELQQTLEHSRNRNIRMKHFRRFHSLLFLRHYYCTYRDYWKILTNFQDEKLSWQLTAIAYVPQAEDDGLDPRGDTQSFFLTVTVSSLNTFIKTLPALKGPKKDQSLNSLA